MSLSEYIIVMNHGRAEALANRQDVRQPGSAVRRAIFWGASIFCGARSGVTATRSRRGSQEAGLLTRCPDGLQRETTIGLDRLWLPVRDPERQYAGVTHRQQGYPLVPFDGRWGCRVTARQHSKRPSRVANHLFEMGHPSLEFAAVDRPPFEGRHRALC